MKGKMIIALTGSITLVMIVWLYRNDGNHVGENSARPDNVVIDQNSGLPGELNEAQPPKDLDTKNDKSDTNGAEVQFEPIKDEQIDNNDSSTDSGSVADLPYETQEYIQALAYEVVSSPDISDVAYMHTVECGDSGCAIEMKFFDSQAIAGKSSALLGEINTRLGLNPSTSNLQFGITTMAKGQDGIGTLSLVTVPRSKNSFVITVVEDLNAQEH